MGLFEELYGGLGGLAAQQQVQHWAGFFEQQQAMCGIDPLSDYARQCQAGSIRLQEFVKHRKRVKSRVLSPEEAVRAAVESVKDAQKLLP